MLADVCVDLDATWYDSKQSLKVKPKKLKTNKKIKNCPLFPQIAQKRFLISIRMSMFLPPSC